MFNKNLNQILLVISFVALAVLSRLVSHQWNFTMMGAVALFAGAFLTRKLFAAATVILSLLISDYFIGFHNQMLVVYGSFLAMAFAGSFLNLSSSRLKVLSTSFIGSILFFVLTNLAVWLENSMYPQTLNGLVDCYVMGIPFFRNQFVSDLFFTSVFFEVARATLPALKKSDSYQERPGQSF
jgi:hypothetical protein